MPTVRIRLDKRSDRMVKKMALFLPSKFLNPALNRAATNTAKAARAAATTQKGGSTLGKKIMQSHTGASGQVTKSRKRSRKTPVAKKGRAVFWMVVKDYILHRVGKAKRVSGGAVATAAGAPIQRNVFVRGGFVIGKRLFSGRKGKKKIQAYYNSYRPMLRAFNRGVAVAARRFPIQVEKGVESALKRWRAVVSK